MFPAAEGTRHKKKGDLNLIVPQVSWPLKKRKSLEPAVGVVATIELEKKGEKEGTAEDHLRKQPTKKKLPGPRPLGNKGL